MATVASIYACITADAAGVTSTAEEEVQMCTEFEAESSATSIPFGMQRLVLLDCAFMSVIIL